MAYPRLNCVGPLPLDHYSWTPYRSESQLEIKCFFPGAQLHFRSYLKMLCIETITSLGSLQKFEGAVGEFKRVMGSRHPLISSPDSYANGNYMSVQLATYQTFSYHKTTLFQPHMCHKRQVFFGKGIIIEQC